MRNPLPALAAPLALLVSVSLTACTDELCREPGPECPCTDLEAQYDDVVVALVNYGSTSSVAGIHRLADRSPALASLLGFDDASTVVIATYDDVGGITERATFDLDGNGTTETRQEADAEHAAACLSESADALPSTRTPGNLVRALGPAAELAATRSSGDAAVVAFGLGRSALDDPTSPTDLPLAGIDLTTDDAQAHVVDVLTHVGQVPVRDDVVIVLVDPDEDVENSVVAGNINRFAEGPLCLAVNPTSCEVVEVLP